MKLLFYALLSVLAFASCNIINPDEREPAYLQVENYTFTTEAGQGTSSEKITEMWVNANDNILSIVSPGAQIPVLNEGDTKISVLAGIKNFGASDMRIHYPFYQPFDTTIHFTPLSYHKIHPRFKYYPNALIDATRNFESGNNFLEVDGINQGILEEVNNPEIAFEGSRCLRLYLTENNSLILFQDQNEIDIESGNTVFLEMNYSCNQPFTIGIESTEGSTLRSNDMVTMSATADGTDIVWNKIYIDLGEIGLLYPGASAHNIYVKCVKSGSDLPVIYLDNLKVVMWQ